MDERFNTNNRDADLHPEKEVEALSKEEILNEYTLKLDLYGLKGNSKEFNDRIEKLALNLRQCNIPPDFDKVTKDMLERSVPYLDKKIEKAEQCAKDLNNGITLDDFFNKYSRYEDVKIKYPSGSEQNIDIALKNIELNQEYDFDLDKNIYKLGDVEIDPNTKVVDLFIKGISFESLNKTKIIEKHQRPSIALQEVLINKYSDTREIVLEREYGEPLLKSLKKIYDAKEIRDPNLSYGLKNYNRCDQTAKIYVQAFVNSLTPNEKIALIPKDKKEAELLTRNIFSLTDLDNLYRPIYGYGFYNEKMIDFMSEALQNKNCVELGCGNGMLSRLLQDRGVDVTPIDLNNEKNNSYDALRMNKPATDIVYMDAKEYLEKNNNNIDIVILCWPPHHNSMASDVVKTMAEKCPEAKILYIGEGCDGCTADFEFFEITELAKFEITELAKEKELISKIDEEHANYPYIYDYVTLLQPQIR